MREEHQKVQNHIVKRFPFLLRHLHNHSLYQCCTLTWGICPNNTLHSSIRVARSPLVAAWLLTNDTTNLDFLVSSGFFFFFVLNNQMQKLIENIRITRIYKVLPLLTWQLSACITMLIISYIIWKKSLVYILLFR